MNYLDDYEQALNPLKEVFVWIVLVPFFLVVIPLYLFLRFKKK